MNKIKKDHNVLTVEQCNGCTEGDTSNHSIVQTGVAAPSEINGFEHE
jgi:hypothetical protein